MELESVCQQKMQQAIETEEGLGIEYDEDVVCDVCRSPEGEDGNEMVFCDKCNVCVHQVSNYGLKFFTFFCLCTVVELYALYAPCIWSFCRFLQNKKATEYMNCTKVHIEQFFHKYFP